MNCLISFSLWGKNPTYNEGAIFNAKLAKEIYPEYHTRFYCQQDTPSETIHILKEEGAQIVVMSTKNSWDGLFHRYFPSIEKDVDVLLVRDTDSRLNMREKSAVEEFLNSDYEFHCLRDHRSHNMPVLCGLTAIKYPILSNLNNQINNWMLNRLTEKGDDQLFFAKVIWNQIKEKTLCHDRYLLGNLFDDGYFYRPIDFFGEHVIRKFPTEPIILPNGEEDHCGKIHLLGDQ